ncbi:hypothetical protein HMPREF3098_01385 [Corynebacterium sp. HMSC28B08]|nr:hypothetical protein HMPREF3098_01385 [Corynebacterium sp. HMSC28B08]
MSTAPRVVGDPHVHAHVLVNNKQRSLDGKFRTIDGVSLYHEARAAGMLYQAQLRAEISSSLGVQRGQAKNGCAEIIGLDDAEMPTVAQVVNAVIAERSTFTWADIFEVAAGLVPAEVARENIYDRLEYLVDGVMNSGVAWTVTPERDFRKRH